MSYQKMNFFLKFSKDIITKPHNTVQNIKLYPKVRLKCTLIADQKLKITMLMKNKSTSLLKDVFNTKFKSRCEAVEKLKYANQVLLRIISTDQSNQEPNPQSNQHALSSRLKEAVSKVIPLKKEISQDGIKALSRERNFITTVRAMTEFLLAPSDLEGLRKTSRRSPFEDEPPITVFWRKDVEAKAIKVWGSLEALEKQKSIRDKGKIHYNDPVLDLKRILTVYKRESRKSNSFGAGKSNFNHLDSSATVVRTAVIINAANFVGKLFAWAITGSHSLFAEALHSFADFTNQLILAYGIYKSKQQANIEHPYGYTTMRNVSSLISGAMIFCIGAGLSIQHGISGLIHGGDVLPLHTAFYILGASLISESVTLAMAVNSIYKGAKLEDSTFKDYVLRGTDPSVNVVLLEDLAAVLGVGVAMSCMGLTSVLGTHIPDAIGSCIIGGLLASVSAFIIYTNSAALVGKSIPQHEIQKINNELEADVMIRFIHDVKGIEMGSGFVRYKAEVDFDGRELTRKYLNKHDLNNLYQYEWIFAVCVTEPFIMWLCQSLPVHFPIGAFASQDVKNLESIEELEQFLLSHGESIVDGLGAEVDRIEKSLKKNNPKVRHIDLEIL